MSRSQLPMLAVATAVTFWGFGGVLVKLMSIDAVSLAFYRLWLAFLLMLLILAVARKSFTRDALRRTAPAGLIFGINVMFYFSAVRLTTVANANLIASLQPALVLVVAGPLFGERVSGRQLAWTGVALTGVAIVIVASAGTPDWHPAGDALAFCATLTFTCYFIVSKKTRATLGTLEFMTGVQLWSALIVTPFALLPAGHLEALSGNDWLWLAIIVIGTGVGGHLLVNWAHPYIDITLSSLMMVLVPVVAGVAAWLILDEALTALQIAGSLVTLAAIVIVVRSEGPAEEAAEPLAGETLTYEG